MRVFVLWIAILAVLMGAVAPAISQARHKAGSSDWVYVCTPRGAKWLSAGEPVPDGQAPGSPIAHLFEHCPYCSLHAAGLGMPPATLELAELPHGHAPHRCCVVAAPSRLIWLGALSRGPPAIA